MNIDLIQVVFSLVSIILTGFIVPYLKLKLSQEQIKSAQTWVDMAIKAVDQMPEFRDKTGAEKKAYVVNFLNQKGFKVSSEELNTMIESSVNIMKTAKALIVQK